MLPRAISNCPPLFPSSILDTFQPGGLNFQCLIVLPFIFFTKFSQQKYWSGLPFASSVGHSSVPFSSVTVVSNSLQPHESQHARPPCPSPTPQSLLRLMSIESVMPSSHLILCRPLLLLPPIPPIIRVFSSESALCLRWPEYWSFSFNISPSSEHPGLISFMMDWLDLLAVQGTLKSLLQHHSLEA